MSLKNNTVSAKITVQNVVGDTFSCPDKVARAGAGVIGSGGTVYKLTLLDGNWNSVLLFGLGGSAYQPWPYDSLTPEKVATVWSSRLHRN